MDKSYASLRAPFHPAAHPALHYTHHLARWADFLRLFFVGLTLDGRDLQREKALVERARHDPEAFGELYEQNYDRILNYVVRRTASVETAQDITAETFYKAYKNIGKFTWQEVPFQAWLYRIAQSEIGLWHRKRFSPSVSLSLLQEQGFDPAAEQDVEKEILAAEEELLRHQDFLIAQKQLDALPEKYREVLFLRFFAELSLQEIATVLEKPLGTIKSLLHRGLEKLLIMTTAAKSSATQSSNRHYKA